MIAYKIIIIILSLLLVAESVAVIFFAMRKASDVAYYEDKLTKQNTTLENIWDSYSKVVEEYNQSLVDRQKSLDETSKQFEKYEKDIAVRDKVIADKDEEIKALRASLNSIYGVPMSENPIDRCDDHYESEN